MGLGGKGQGGGTHRARHLIQLAHGFVDSSFQVIIQFPRSVGRHLRCLTTRCHYDAGQAATNQSSERPSHYPITVCSLMLTTFEHPFSEIFPTQLPELHWTNRTPSFWSRRAGPLTSGLFWRLGQAPPGRELVFSASPAPPGGTEKSQRVQDGELVAPLPPWPEDKNTGFILTFWGKLGPDALLALETYELVCEVYWTTYW